MQPELWVNEGLEINGIVPLKVLAYVKSESSADNENENDDVPVHYSKEGNLMRENLL